jgi:hypothetical protein
MALLRQFSLPMAVVLRLRKGQAQLRGTSVGKWPK